MEYCIALSDLLCRELNAFKHNQGFDVATVEKMLHLYKPPHITNVAQLKRIGISNSPLEAQLAKAGLIEQTIEELAMKTLYKIVLDSENREFPYVNINNDPVQNNYAILCAPGQDRDKAQDHVRALLENAKSVLIFDKYIAANWKSTRRLFDELMPQKSLSIFYADNHLQSVAGDIKKICRQWTIKPDRNKTYADHHDRYIRIDQKIEIVLTSGIDYLFDDAKECTLLIRKVR
ncbi:MAG: hypothetical protein HF982_00635 [Desulfobacteraceae bacterium]|nr:hypothetical protein [Desulfobacteraceae bacterium]MBC2718106.1 hypothetical protein [Desulfobacteraceae bacterium]